MKLEWFRPYSNGRPDERIRALTGKSGVYLIRSAKTRRILYVGESHTGRLRKTLLRHFQSWSGPTAGYTTDRNRVEVAVIRTRPDAAPDLQMRMIARLKPRYNDIGKDDVPF